MDYPKASKAEHPPLYATAKQALRLCAQRFTPERYVAATRAVAEAAIIDECSDWPDQIEALEAYLRIADDGEFHRLVRRVEAKRAKWLIEAANG